MNAAKLDRYGLPIAPPVLAEGWALRRLGAEAKLLGANGLRFGADGRLHVAQAVGSQISAIDIDSGAVETVMPVGGFYEPDDLAFDSHGTLYATELMEGRVSAREPDGRTRVIADSLPAANGITIHQDRIFVDECRPGGRMWELYRDGRAPRLICENLHTPNALSLADDGYLYFPSVAGDEILRVDARGGAPERFVGGMAAPVAVKIDAGGRLLALNARSGEVVAVDRQSRGVTRLGVTRPGLDNLDFGPDGRLFVSHYIDGGVSELLGDGRERIIVPPALVGPYGIALDGAGAIYVADGTSLARIAPDGRLSHVAQVLGGPGWPGTLRNLVVDRDGSLIVANSQGGLSRYRPGGIAEPLAADLGQVMGLLLEADGGVLACDAEEGAVVRIADGEASTVARGLGRPTGIAVDGGGRLLVGDSAGGRLVAIEQGVGRTLAEDLVAPHGICVVGGHAYVADRGKRSVEEIDLASGIRRTIASDVPIAPPPGVEERIMPGLLGVHPFPTLPYTGLVADARGSLYLSASGTGSVLRLDRI
jgi:sugar lactone lactonase YvrE